MKQRPTRGSWRGAAGGRAAFGRRRAPPLRATITPRRERAAWPIRVSRSARLRSALDQNDTNVGQPSRCERFRVAIRDALATLSGHHEGGRRSRIQSIEPRLIQVIWSLREERKIATAPVHLGSNRRASERSTFRPRHRRHERRVAPAKHRNHVRPRARGRIGEEQFSSSAERDLESTGHRVHWR